MNHTDRVLDSVQWEVEFNGRSHADCVYLNDISFSIDRCDYEAPSEANLISAEADVAWFFASAKKNMVVPHQSPDDSFWLKFFGEDADPYGYTWNLPLLLENIRSPTAWRRAILCNPLAAKNPSCVLCYQFHPTDGSLDITVTMRSSDVYKILPQDLVMTDLILSKIADLSKLKPGDFTFNIGNAHAFYEDMQYVEESILDWGD